MGLFGVVLTAFLVYCACRIASRMGYSGFAGLLLLIPFVNMVTWVVWAFNESPNERKLRSLRAELARRDGPRVEGALRGMDG
jgi:hypothetical protein